MVGTPMSLDARISKLLPGLSVKERAVLVIRAQNAGEPTTELTRAMPQEQRHQFNKFMGLAFVAGCQFGCLVNVIANQVEDLRFDLERISLLDQAAGILEEDDPESIAAHPVRAWRKQKRVGVPVFLRGLAVEMREDAYKELTLRHQELCAVDAVTAEMGENFDGEDLLHPEVRAKLVSCAAVVDELNLSLGDGKRRKLPPPDDGHLGRTRELVEHGFSALGLVEETP